MPIILGDLFPTLYMILRSASGLKSASTNVIISNHGQISMVDPFQILRSMADLLVRDKVRAYVSDIGRRFEKVRNSHRFENWMPI